jgi:hypothetical protein
VGSGQSWYQIMRGLFQIMGLISQEFLNLLFVIYVLNVASSGLGNRASEINDDDELGR